LKNWIAIAKQTEVPELVKMAETLERHFKGITAYWRADRLSNSAMEGFNNKIRWLIRQAYGFRDREYFKLKIYDLQTLRLENRYDYVAESAEEACFFIYNVEKAQIETNLLQRRQQELRIWKKNLQHWKVPLLFRTGSSKSSAR
jgi:hypothetical protein